MTSATVRQYQYMAWLIPTPRDAIAAARSVLGWTVDATTLLVVLPVRIAALLAAVEQLLARVSQVVDNAALTVAQAHTVALRAGGVVDGASAVSAQAQQLVDVYRPMALRLAPMAEQLVASISEAEVQTAIKLIDQLPKLLEDLETDIMPILSTLDRVGPDISNLLDVAKDVREAVVGIPGFKFLRKRGEHKVGEHDQPDNPAG